MARERYLVGISEEELRPDPKFDEPKTPKGKWENYWYHYKWQTFGVLAAALILTVFIYQMANRPKYDYEVIIAVESYVGAPAQEYMRKELEKYGRDLNGDGEVKIGLQTLNLGETDPQMMQAAQTKLMVSLSTADVMFFIFDEPIYNMRFGKNDRNPEPIDFFAPIGLDNPDISPEFHYWNWKNFPLRNEPEMISPYTGQPELPLDLYFGVRKATGSAEKRTDMQEECLELLRNFITGTVPVSE